MLTSTPKWAFSSLCRDELGKPGCLPTSGFEPHSDGLVHLGNVSVPPIVQGRFSLCAELLEPSIGSGSTDADSCTTRRFPPGVSLLHQDHHLLFCRLAWLSFHNTCLFRSLSLFLSSLSGSHAAARFCPLGPGRRRSSSANQAHPSSYGERAQRTSDLAMRISGRPCPLASGMTPTIT
jgi:hypothetical protein